MTRINLLPWREQRRKELRRQFVSTSIGAAILMGVIIVYIHLYIGVQISAQNERNDFLKQQISVVDKKISEITELEAEKKGLLSRMEIIQELQGRRPGVVHLFDELAKAVPTGIYLIGVKQNGNKLIIKGVAQSNARVSALMRNMDETPWFESPRLEVIEIEKQGKSRKSQFTLHVTQTSPSNEVDEL